MAMKEAQPRAIRREEYAPPAFLVDRTDLRFELDEGVTTVTAELRLRRNPAGEADAPLVLDGQELELVSLALDGEPLSANRYRLDAE